MIYFIEYNIIMFLSNYDFSTLCNLSQLIAIDLLIYYQDKLLLGLRKNEPAKNYYFVPGGRIHKMEQINDAIQRISNLELGITLDEKRIKKRGVYEHIYNNSFIDEYVSTHYIVFPISYILNNNEYNLIITNNVFFNQHQNYLWCDKNMIHENNDIHHYVKYYFVDNPPNKFL